MDDEFNQTRKRTQTQTERGGSGRWGGPPRTAIGTEGEGGSSGPAGTVKPRVAICHSDSSVEFALYCAIRPLVEAGLIEISSAASLDLERRSARKLRIADIVVTEPALGSVSSAFGSATSYYPRIIALVPTHIASQYLWRFYRNGISVCPWRYGLQGVLNTIRLSLNQRDDKVIYDDAIDFFFSTAFGIVSLSDMQGKLLRRLQFSEKTLLAEFDISSSKLDLMKEELFHTLEVTTAEAAIQVGKQHGVTQLPAEPNSNETQAFADEIAATVSAWLERSLTRSEL